MTTNHHRSEARTDDPPGAALALCARSAETAIRQLAHLLTSEPELTPAEVDVILVHLASGVAALPQVAARLGDVLDRCRDAYQLSMDGMTATSDPDIAIDTARLHLGALRDPAVETYRHLDAARNEAAHIGATGRAPAEEVPPERATGGRHPRPEEREPHTRPTPSPRGPAR